MFFFSNCTVPEHTVSFFPREGIEISWCLGGSQIPIHVKKIYQGQLEFPEGRSGVLKTSLLVGEV